MRPSRSFTYLTTPTTRAAWRRFQAPTGLADRPYGSGIAGRLFLLLAGNKPPKRDPSYTNSHASSAATGVYAVDNEPSANAQ